MCNFVSVIAALAVLGASVLAGPEEDFKKLDTKIASTLEKCKASSEVTDEHLKSMISGEVPLKGKTGCFLACVGKEFEVVKANNMLDKEKIYKLVEPLMAQAKDLKMDGFISEVKKVVDSCLATQQGGDDACAAAKNVGECISSNMKKAGLFK